jgi:hypothetical protein
MGAGALDLAGVRRLSPTSAGSSTLSGPPRLRLSVSDIDGRYSLRLRGIRAGRAKVILVDFRRHTFVIKKGLPARS